MDITNKPIGAAPVTDDQELAKVLESMNKDIPSVTPPPAATADAPDENSVPQDTSVAPPMPPAPDTSAAASEIPMPSFETPGMPPLPTSESSDPMTTTGAVSEPETTLAPEPEIQFSSTPTFDVTAAPTSTGDSELDSIKKNVLVELRPLVDRLTLPADEKFDTLLLLIRSTDDKTLIPAAHEAAKLIEDDTKRAEALLDIIKEIDYFTKPQQS